MGFAARNMRLWPGLAQLKVLPSSSGIVPNDGMRAWPHEVQVADKAAATHLAQLTVVTFQQHHCA